MDLVLRSHLPIELVEIIMRMVHELNYIDVRHQLIYCITWIHYENEYSYIISNNFNYYHLLDRDHLME